MLPIFYIEYELRPAAHSEEFATTGGAFTNCFVQAQDAEAAQAAALRYFEETAWEVVATEQAPEVIQRADLQDDEDRLDAFDEAERHGECFLFHLWPPGAGDDDSLH